MADDAAAVLDGVGLDSAHVYGISLGGMVAQNLVLRHPERVRSLVLGATHAGGPPGDPARREVLAFFRRRAGMAMEEAAWASVPYNYGPRCREEQVDRIAEDIERRLENPFKPAAYRAQLIRRRPAQHATGGSRASRRRRSSSTGSTTASSPSRTRA